MTEDTIALRALLEKGSDATFLREMIGFAAQRLMELETDGLCGAGQARPRVPKLAALMDDAEADVLAYMGVPRPAPCQAALHQPARAAQR